MNAIGHTNMDSPVSVIESEEVSYLPAATLLRLVEKSQKAAKNSKAFKAVVMANPELFRRFEELDIEPNFDLQDDYIHLPFTGDGHKLGVVWGALRQAGFNTSLRPEKGSTTFYCFWDKEGETRLFMDFTSSVCRRVKVGTKTVEQDVYEVRCGELPVIEPSANMVVTAGEINNDLPFV